MSEDVITRAEHDAFAELMRSENSRLKEENDRQNKRIGALEENSRQITELTASVRELAVNMQNMNKELSRQCDQMEMQARRTGERLEKLESQDGEKWRKAIAYIGTAILGAILAIVFAKIGL